MKCFNEMIALHSLTFNHVIFTKNATNENIECLRDIVKSSGADTVVTIDGFWMGTRLVRTKELLDAAITDIVYFMLTIINVDKNYLKDYR